MWTAEDKTAVICSDSAGNRVAYYDFQVSERIQGKLKPDGPEKSGHAGMGLGTLWLGEQQNDRRAS